MKEKIMEILSEVANRNITPLGGLDKIRLLLKMQPKKRYFVVWYSVSNKREYIFSQQSDCGFRFKEFQKQRAEHFNVVPDDIFITNWIELSEADYNDWIK